MTPEVAEPRYAKITARTTCSACGQPIPLVTLTEQASCPYCNAPNQIPIPLWKTVALAADDASAATGSRDGTLREGARELVYTVCQGVPACEACNQTLPVAALPQGARQNFACTSCGDPASTEPVPRWLRPDVSPARQLYSLDPKADGKGHAALRPKEEAAKPILMACPRCSGGLEITVQSERLLTCKFCNGEVYLPDEVWRRLHPIKQVLPFYLSFVGPTVAMERMASEARAAAERQEAIERAAAVERAALDERMQEQEARRAQAAAERAQQVSRAKMLAWLSVLAFVLALGLAAAASWVAALVGTPPTSMLVACAVILGSILLVVNGIATRPIQISTARPFEWLLFITWFWLPFVLLMPGFGQVMGLWRAVALARGKFMGSTIKSNGHSRSYPAIELPDGEGRPAALLFFSLVTLWPMLMLPYVSPETFARLLGITGR